MYRAVTSDGRHDADELVGRDADADAEANYLRRNAMHEERHRERERVIERAQIASRLSAIEERRRMHLAFMFLGARKWHTGHEPRSTDREKKKCVQVVVVAAHERVLARICERTVRPRLRTCNTSATSDQPDQRTNNVPNAQVGRQGRAISLEHSF